MIASLVRISAYACEQINTTRTIASAHTVFVSTIHDVLGFNSCGTPRKGTLVLAQLVSWLWISACACEDTNMQETIGP